VVQLFSRAGGFFRKISLGNFGRIASEANHRAAHSAAHTSIFWAFRRTEDSIDHSPRTHRPTTATMVRLTSPAQPSTPIEQPPALEYSSIDGLELTALAITGPIRSDRNRQLKVCPRPRLLPSRLFQEHPGNRSGDQWLEATARCCLP
jgi:hypothetical protein